jgi:hypothetical protein
MPQSYLGNMGLVQGINSGDPFFNRLGSTVNEKTYCTSGSSSAWLLTYGPTGGVDPESFVHCKYIVIWACNSISTNLHHWPFVLEAQKRGAKVVVVDAYKSRTAKAGDWHICPRPGTDGALAMGVINSMIQDAFLEVGRLQHVVVGGPFEIRAVGQLEGAVEVGRRADVHGLAVIADARVGGGVALADRRRIVGRRVVGDDQLEVTVALSQDRLDGFGNMMLPVADRQPDADSRSFGHAQLRSLRPEVAPNGLLHPPR